MDVSLDTCPYCGQKILKGAMRCVGCSRILKTPEEQLATIEKYRESEKRPDLRKIFKLVFLLAAIGIIYYFFSDRIAGFIRFIRNTIGV